MIPLFQRRDQLWYIARYRNDEVKVQDSTADSSETSDQASKRYLDLVVEGNLLCGKIKSATLLEATSGWCRAYLKIIDGHIQVAKALPQNDERHKTFWNGLKYINDSHLVCLACSGTSTKTMLSRSHDKAMPAGSPAANI
ncbi:hypothetical protein J6590_058823 [Homalodisca vitripennis]|nr:hypothetical protein J6590_058823 [Homalodisca vitripennis]